MGCKGSGGITAKIERRYLISLFSLGSGGLGHGSGLAALAARSAEVGFAESPGLFSAQVSEKYKDGTEKERNKPLARRIRTVENPFAGARENPRVS